MPTPRKKKLSGEVALVTVAQVAEQAGIFLLTMLMARLVSVQEYGSFRQLWMVHRTLLQIFLVGLPVSIAYFLPRLVLRRQRGLVARSALMLLALGVVVAGGMYAGADALANAFNNPELAPLLRIFGLFTMLILPTAPLRAVMVNHGRSRDLAIFTLADQAALLGVCVGAMLLTGELATLVSAMVVMALLRLAAAMTLIFTALRGGREDGERVPLGAQVRFALPAGVGSMFDALNVMLDKFVAATFFSIENFARYANGAFHVPMVSMVVSSVSSVLLPEYVRMHASGDVAGILRLWHKSVRATAMLFLPMVAFLVAFAEPFVTLIFSAKYADSAVIFQIYILSLLPRMTDFAFVLAGMGRTRVQIAASLMSLAVNLVISLALVKAIGVLGPALGTVVADTALAGYYLVRIREATGVSWRAVFPWAMLGKLSLTAALVAAVCWPINYLPLRFAAAPLAIGGLAFAALHLLLTYFTRQVSSDDLGMIRVMLKRPKPAAKP